MNWWNSSHYWTNRPKQTVGIQGIIVRNTIVWRWLPSLALEIWNKLRLLLQTSNPASCEWDERRWGGGRWRWCRRPQDRQRLEEPGRIPLSHLSWSYWAAPSQGTQSGQRVWSPGVGGWCRDHNLPEDPWAGCCCSLSGLWSWGWSLFQAFHRRLDEFEGRAEVLQTLRLVASAAIPHFVIWLRWASIVKSLYKCYDQSGKQWLLRKSWLLDLCF